MTFLKRVIVTLLRFIADTDHSDNTTKRRNYFFLKKYYKELDYSQPSNPKSKAYKDWLFVKHQVKEFSTSIVKFGDLDVSDEDIVQAMQINPYEVMQLQKKLLSGECCRVEFMDEIKKIVDTIGGLAVIKEEESNPDFVMNDEFFLFLPPDQCVIPPSAKNCVDCNWKDQCPQFKAQCHKLLS